MKDAGNGKHILNVGHGVAQGTPEENVGHFCDAARASLYAGGWRPGALGNFCHYLTKSELKCANRFFRVRAASRPARKLISQPSSP